MSITLRVCANCEWIFKARKNNPDCPQCRFGSYDAKNVYGNVAYKYAKTQKPWRDKKMFLYGIKLDQEIENAKT